MRHLPARRCDAARKRRHAKFEAVCRKLDLKPTDHVLEIGTGWGGFAIHAAQRYGCRVTTTTISAAQHDYAVQQDRRARACPTASRCCSRTIATSTGQYDKLVSIEMVEAVGAHFLDAISEHCSRLLKPEGAMLLQAITIQDQFYEQALKSVDYIQRYIFPGSFIPSVAGAVEVAGQGHRPQDIPPRRHRPALRAHAAPVARALLRATCAEVRELGYTDSFVRLWEYYLCYCEGGFIERQLGTVQMLLTKPGCRRDAARGAA